ncbi:MAG: CvpA family protein [Epsilonproteobacteria bacterium]|nr:CvpA family protein [Campylobacterota bacterium]
MDQFTTFDLIVGSIIIFLGLKGLIDGFVKEFFGIAGIVGGIYYGSRYAHLIGEWISQNVFPIKNDAALSFIGFLVGLFAIWMGMVFIGNIVTKLTQASGMGFFNKIFGLLFGWLKIFLILSILVYAISSIEATKKIVQKYTKDSILYPLMIKTGGYIIKFKPQDLLSPETKEQAKNIGEEIKETTIQTTGEEILKQLENNKSKQ